MEVKILLDQLNSACEDLDLPQAGFPIQDDLHQGFFEPEFRGFTVNGKQRVSWNEFPWGQAVTRWKHLYRQIEEYSKKPEYEVTGFDALKSNLHRFADDKKRETEVRVKRTDDGSRLCWNIGWCKCIDSCSNTENCVKLKITWKEDYYRALPQEGQDNFIEDLFHTFEVTTCKRYTDWFWVFNDDEIVRHMCSEAKDDLVKMKKVYPKIFRTKRKNSSVQYDAPNPKSVKSSEDTEEEDSN
eukprot:GHVP01040802.1.p1 GENE.GHVP01040802.1~~GHVP01040802.1.p1  ORF type:complete len:249 (+),score=39.48 GHVP01040802.1:25-747(+)